MFDLEKAIADWRRQMLAAGIKTPVPLEELEIHLREEIERQTKSGLDEQPAFEIAVRQIGQAGVLKNEFKNTQATLLGVISASDFKNVFSGNMNTKIPFIIVSALAAAIGIVCLGLALWMHFWMQYVALKILATAPTAAEAFVDERWVYWPLFIGSVCMTLAGSSFLSLFLSRKKHPHEQVS